MSGSRMKQIMSIAVVFVALAGMFVASAPAQSPARKIVEIKIENNVSVSQQTIFTHLRSKIGDEFAQATLSDDIKRLYATGFFRDVSASVESPTPTTARIVFTVEEKPVIGEVMFSGNRRLKTRALQRKIQIKRGDIFDQFKIKEDVDSIRRFYIEKGFARVTVSTRAESATDATLTVWFDIAEGARHFIRRIAFVGNDAVARPRLQKIIRTKRRGFFRSGFLKEDVLAEDAESILVFYRQEGFLDAAVEHQIREQPQESGLEVAFVITEGKQYRVGSVSFSGHSVLTRERLAALAALRTGAVYSEQKLRVDIAAFQSAYFDQGYIAAIVKVDTVLNPQTGAVDISFAIQEGTQAYVDSVTIRGNDRTRDVVIRREIRLFPGDVYNGEKLRRSRQRLYNLGFFDEVTFETAKEPTTRPDQYDLDVFVKEAKTGEFSFGAGYSSIDKFIGFLDLTQRNFDLWNWKNFTGGGQQMSGRVEFGSERRQYNLSFVEPWFLGYPVSTGFTLYNRLREWESYTEKRVGGTVFFGREFGEYVRLQTTYRKENVRISDLAPNVIGDIRQEEGKNIIHSVSQEFVHDRRDNAFNPTTGWFNLYMIDVAGGKLGGDRNFVKHYTQHSKYLPVTPKSVLELKIRGGIVETYADRGTVPIYERFYAGGANTIRGYKERHVGPKDSNGDPTGGRLMLVANSEYSFQVAENLKWAFFYDIGNVWQRHSLLDFEGLKLKAGIGTGIRVKTPLGPIRIDYGYALHPTPGEARGRFHFTMGSNF